MSGARPIWRPAALAAALLVISCGPSAELIEARRELAQCKTAKEVAESRALSQSIRGDTATTKARSFERRAEQAEAQERSTAEELTRLRHALATKGREVNALEDRLRTAQLRTDLRVGDVGYRIAEDGLRRVTAEGEATVVEVREGTSCAVDNRSAVVWIDAQSGLYGYDLMDGRLHNLLAPTTATKRIRYDDDEEITLGSQEYSVYLLVKLATQESEAKHLCLPYACDGTMDARERGEYSRAKSLNLRETAWISDVITRHQGAKPMRQIEALPHVQVGGHSWQCDGFNDTPCGEAHPLPKTDYWHVLAGSSRGDLLWENFVLYDPRTDSFAHPAAPWRRSPSLSPEFYVPSGPLFLAPSGDYWVTGGLWVDLTREATKTAEGFCGFIRGWRTYGSL